MVPGSEGERWDQIVDVEMETDDEDDEELEDGDEPRVPRWDFLCCDRSTIFKIVDWTFSIKFRL